MGSSGSDQYNGIVEATESIRNTEEYPGAEKILSESPSKTQIERWTNALSGFEANSEISPEENNALLEVTGLLETSKGSLTIYALELDVNQLGRSDADIVLFMVCIRDLQIQHGLIPNLNSHKLDVLRGGRYQITGTSDKSSTSFDKPKSESQLPNLNWSEQPPDRISPNRADTTVSRIIRTTSLANGLKEQYNHECQVCGEHRKRDNSNRYAEAHHIQPLGADNPGPDVAENILILCPNHHSDFDYGLVKIDPENLIVKHAYEKSVDKTPLYVTDSHKIGEEFIEYHNNEVSVL